MSNKSHQGVKKEINTIQKPPNTTLENKKYLQVSRKHKKISRKPRNKGKKYESAKKRVVVIGIGLLVDIDSSEDTRCGRRRLPVQEGVGESSTGGETFLDVVFQTLFHKVQCNW